MGWLFCHSGVYLAIIEWSGTLSWVSALELTVSAGEGCPCEFMESLAHLKSVSTSSGSFEARKPSINKSERSVYFLLGLVFL